MVSRELVSIIIPTHFRNDMLAQAIECANNQTYSDIEILVVDDSGERHAQDVCDQYDVTYLPHEENKGSNAARNTGIREASGKYVQLLDDDDEIYPEKIELQVELLESSPSIGVAYGGIKKRNGREILPREVDPEDSLKTALQFGWWTTITSSLLISREILLRIYPLIDRKAADDIGFKIRLARHTNFDYVNRILTKIGDVKGSRSDSPVVAEALREIIEENEHLYQQFPDYVRRNAINYMYVQKGHLLLEERYWSPAATVCFVKALYYRGFNLRSVATICLSLFGLPGIWFGKYMFKTFRLER